jgi:hypothetical protein
MAGPPSFTRRSIVALAGCLAAAILAGAMALVINLGIFSSIGSPGGPGTLGVQPTVHILRYGRVHDDLRNAPIRPAATMAAPGMTPRLPGHEMEHRYGAANDD